MAQQTQQVSTREKLSQVLIYATMLVPLVVGTSFAIFPFIFPKALYFEIMVGLLAACTVPLIVWQKKYRARTAYFYTLGAYALALFLAGIFAQEPSRAFWSNFERMTGIIFIWFAMLFSALVASYYSVFIQKLRGFLAYLVGVSVIVAFTGIYQRFDTGFLMSQSNRVAGVFGNPIYLGGFAAQLGFISAYLFYINRQKSIKWWYAFATCINALALYLSGTRGAMFGVAVGCVIVGSYYARRMWKAGRRAPVIATVIVILATGAALFALPRVIPSLKDSLLGRFTDVSIGTSTASTRIIAWEIAIKGFKERPILGWGPENFYYVFNKFYNPKSLTFGTYETWFDHAHNAVFDVLVTQGLLGILLYLLQYGVIIWMCYKTRGADENENILSVVLIGIFAIHFVHNLFVFDHPGSYAEFYALGGIVAARYIAWRRLQSTESVVSVAAAEKPSVFLGNAASIVALLITAYVVIPGARQNYIDLQAQKNAAQNIQLAQQYFKDAISINGPFTPDVLLDVGRVAQRLPPTVNGNQSFLTIPQFKDYYEFSLSSLDKLITLYDPGALLAVLMKAQLLMNAVQVGDKTAAVQADAAFKLATQLSPDRQQIAYSWARLKLVTGDIEGATALLEAANAKEPTIGMGHWYLAVILVETNPQRAIEELDLASRYGFDITLPANRFVAASIYYRGNNFEKAASLYALGLADPASSGQWDTQAIHAADSAFIQTKQFDRQALLRKQFPDEFKKK